MVPSSARRIVTVTEVPMGPMRVPANCFGDMPLTALPSTAACVFQHRTRQEAQHLACRPEQASTPSLGRVYRDRGQERKLSTRGSDCRLAMQQGHIRISPTSSSPLWTLPDNCKQVNLVSCLILSTMHRERKTTLSTKSFESNIL
jgi:hypothetical protein